MEDLAAASPAAVEAEVLRTRAALAPSFDALMGAGISAEQAGSALRGLIKEIRVDNPRVIVVIAAA